MTVRITSYLNFNGNAKDALNFYHGIFGGSVDSDTFKEFNDASGGAMPMPAEDDNKIMHATLSGEHVALMISDVPSTWPAMPERSNITLALSGDDESTLRGYWGKLVEGGTVSQELEAAPWGDTFGSLTDKFGTTWMFDIG